MNTQELNEAIRTLSIRAEKLPVDKQIQLRETLTNNPGTDLETIHWLILMHEHSDDDGNITNKTLRNIIDRSGANP